MAVGMALVILGFEYLADDSVINLVYKVAQLYLRADPGYVRLWDVHAPEDPRRLDARGRRCRPRAERLVQYWAGARRGTTGSGSNF